MHQVTLEGVQQQRSDRRQSFRSCFRQIDVLVEVLLVEDDALTDAQKRNSARPLKLPNCCDCAREIQCSLLNVQKAGSYCRRRRLLFHETRLRLEPSWLGGR